MKLLTHNMLSCHIKGVKNGYPFKIEAETVEVRESDFDPDFLRHIYPRIEWAALREAASSMGAPPPPPHAAPKRGAAHAPTQRLSSNTKNNNIQDTPHPS